LYTDSVFSVGIRSVFLGIYHTDTEGKFGGYISVSKRGQCPREVYKKGGDQYRPKYRKSSKSDTGKIPIPKKTAGNTAVYNSNLHTHYTNSHLYSKIFFFNLIQEYVYSKIFFFNLIQEKKIFFFNLIREYEFKRGFATGCFGHRVFLVTHNAVKYSNGH